MEQTAFVVSIVAVVLGGIGLIGGVLGYAQGAAALQRSASARQRATAAEEAALQARFAAEAAARSAEELLGRVRAGSEQDPGTGPVRTGPIGVEPATTGPAPISRPSSPVFPEAQRFSTGPLPTSMPEPTAGAGLLPAAPAPQEQQTADAFEFPLARALQARLQESGERRASSPTALPAPVAPPGVQARQPDRSAAPAVSSTAVSTPAAAELDPVGPGRAVEGRPPEATGLPVPPAPPPAERPSPDAEDSVSIQTVQIVSAPERTQSESEPVPEPQDEPEPEPTFDAPRPGIDPPPVGVSIEALADAFEEASRSGEQDPSSDDETQPERGSRGQVVARPQDAPPMDWAEVLRTGAIPLPSISRGTYAAPRRSPKPTREGPARFELRVTGRQRFEAVNVGAEEARDARLEGTGDDPHLVRPLSARPASVPPGGGLPFSVLRVEGRGASAQVRWTVDGVEQVQALPLD